MQNRLNSSNRLKAISCCSGDFGRTVIPIDRQKSEQSKQRTWAMWRPNVAFHHRMTSLCPSDKVLKYLSFILVRAVVLALSYSSYEPSCLKNALIIGVILKVIVDARGVEPLSRIPSPVASTRLDPYVWITQGRTEVHLHHPVFGAGFLFSVPRLYLRAEGAFPGACFVRRLRAPGLPERTVRGRI